jgi:hypothetical protein
LINSRKILNLVAGWGMLIALSACNGVMDGIYDDPQKPAQGDLYVDATSWTEWHYVKFNNSQLSTLNPQFSTTIAQLSLFVLALLGGYSRIYLSQHFSADVFAGIVVGILITIVCYAIFVRFEDKKWYNYRLFAKK